MSAPPDSTSPHEPEPDSLNPDDPGVHPASPMIFRLVEAEAEPLPAVLTPTLRAAGTIGPIRVAWSVAIAGTRQTIEVQLWPPAEWFGLAQQPDDVRALPNGYRIALRLI